MQALEQVRDGDVKARAPMHRKGSLKGLITDPANLKERLTARRQELQMSQGEVAKQITFWNNKQQKWTTLSRSAYCMYESGEVVPDLDKINRLSGVLHCSPEWLAFGIGKQTSIEVVDYDADANDFTPKSHWTLDEGWIRSRFEVEPSEIVLCLVNDFSPMLSPGDMAVVKRGVAPTTSGGEFVFTYVDDTREHELTVAHITRPHVGSYRIYDADRSTHQEVEAGEVRFLGKVIGKLGL